MDDNLGTRAKKLPPFPDGRRFPCFPLTPQKREEGKMGEGRTLAFSQGPGRGTSTQLVYLFILATAGRKKTKSLRETPTLAEKMHFDLLLNQSGN